MSDEGAGGPPVLPGRARTALLDLAAEVLGSLGETETPPALTRIRLFAPARRARAGAGPLTLSPSSATSPSEHGWPAPGGSAHPELAVALEQEQGAAEVPAAAASAADAAELLVGLVLLRPDGWAAAAVRVAEQMERHDDDRARRDLEESAAARLRGLEREVEKLRGELAAARAESGSVGEELAAARRELRRLRADADRARAAARVAQLEGEAQRARAEEAVARAAQEVERERGLGRAAAERAEQALRAGREGRSLADARVRLLLDTVVEAAAGLRRELALPPVDVRPADLVPAVHATPAGAGMTGAPGEPEPATLAAAARPATGSSGRGRLQRHEDGLRRAPARGAAAPARRVPGCARRADGGGSDLRLRRRRCGRPADRAGPGRARALQRGGQQRRRPRPAARAGRAGGARRGGRVERQRGRRAECARSAPGHFPPPRSSGCSAAAESGRGAASGGGLARRGTARRCRDGECVGGEA